MRVLSARIGLLFSTGPKDQVLRGMQVMAMLRLLAAVRMMMARRSMVIISVSGVWVPVSHVGDAVEVVIKRRNSSVVPTIINPPGQCLLP
jgi:hypothetical protein